MKYKKPNGTVIDVHQKSVKYVESLGWKKAEEKPAKEEKKA